MPRHSRLLCRNRLAEKTDVTDKQATQRNTRLVQFRKFVKWRLNLATLALVCIATATFGFASPAEAVIRLGSANTVSLSNGLVGYWSLDGAVTSFKTNTTQDLSGQGNTGQLISMSTTTSPVAGKIGQALMFGNSTNRVWLGTPASLNFSTESFSFGTWVPGIGTSDMPIYHGGAAGSEAGYDMELGTGTWSARVADGSNAFSASFGNEMKYRWVHVFAVVDRSSNQLRAYLNGALVAASDISTLGSVSDAARQGAIGARFGGTFPFNGKIDDVRIYNRALSAGEVQQLYNLGTANAAHSNTVALSNGLVGYWTFDGGSIDWRKNQMTDMSGNGNTGTLVSMSTSTSPVAGKIGQALKLNGTSQYADISLLNNTITYPTITVSAWISPRNPVFDNPRVVANSHTDADNKGFQLRLQNSLNSGIFDVGNGTAQCMAVWSKTLSLGTWDHYVGVYTGNKTLAYINGVEVGSGSCAYQSPPRRLM